MKEIHREDDLLLLARALDSPVRLQIIRLLTQRGKMNLQALAEALGITAGAVTAHIRVLEQAGVVATQSRCARRGSQKICALREDRFLLDIARQQDKADGENAYEAEIPIGSFGRYAAHPTCGLATAERLIGEVDDPRCFDDPQRLSASIVWLFTGFLEYRLPNYLRVSQRARELQISLELSSEAPGTCEDWPSDIHFYLNGVPLGFWTSPGDFGSRRGLYTPEWWPAVFNQYGLLKLLSVNERGSFVDGVKISDVRIGEIGLDYRSDLVFRLEVPGGDAPAGAHVGGMTLFGKNFGNYRQDIRMRMLTGPA